MYLIMYPVMSLVMCLSDPGQFQVDRQFGEEVGPPLVGREPGRGRAVVGHGPADLGNACTTSFRQLQLFEKLADAAVPVAPRNDFVPVESLDADGGIGAGVADDRDAIGLDADLHRLPLVVTAVVQGVDQ